MNDEQINQLARAIKSISFGISADDLGPTGFEALCMAIAGQGNGTPLSEAIMQGNGGIADALDNVAEAIRELALAIKPS